MPALQTIFDRGSGSTPDDYILSEFPGGRQTFESQFLNERNYELSGGGPWQALLGRVAERRKLVGFVDARSEDVMREAADFAMAAGLAVTYRPHTFLSGGECWFVSAAVPGRVSDLVDVDALADQYRAWFERYDAPMCDAIDAELARVGRHITDTYLDFSQVETMPYRKTSAELGASYARTGLLLGYPPVSTAALIGENLGLPGFRRKHTFGAAAL